MTERNELSGDERSALLSIARGAIRHAIAGEPFTAGDAPPTLRVPAGAFVTLKLHGELRGCIGMLEAERPLVDSVADAAVAAATRDRRFARLRPEELDDVSLEISVLGPFVEVGDPNEIVVGRDGLYLRAGLNGGILLPQVASERGWDREAFLDHLCLKAGVPPGTWRRSDACLERFTAEVFGEED